MRGPRTWLFQQLCPHRWEEITDRRATFETFDQGRRVEVTLVEPVYRCVCCGKEVAELPDGRGIDFAGPAVIE